MQRPAITKHLRNIFKSGELDESSVSSILELVRQEGRRIVKRKIEFYNLDAILSVGYRVNSINATKFRQWANKILKEYLLIDNDVYHVGASIKDLGKRWFAIMKIQDTKADQILSHILPTGG